MSAAKQNLSKNLVKKLAAAKKKTYGTESATNSSSNFDIEDGGGAAGIVPQFFSPLQTRNQRKIKESIVSQKSTMQVNELKETNKTDEPSQAKALKSEPKQDIENINDTPIEMQWEPQNWKELLANIRTMRSQSAAPVDTMGCHQCSDDNADAKTQRFHKLVALMLSSQTKDETTYAAMQRLKEQNLTPSKILEHSSSTLEQLLHPVSFYKNKAKYLQKTAQILVDKYDSDIPNNIKELVSLPGVGPKMAHICMATAWDETTGIGVDVHVHRISNRLRWLPKPTKEPDQTRQALEAWLPRELWREVNHLLVGFGQTVCTPLQPHCSECLNQKLCPFGKANRITDRKRMTVADDEDNKINDSTIDVIKHAKFQKKKMPALKLEIVD